ncbi:MAG: hypothetical protein ACJ77A_00465 [Actinomycetota bacterium]
MLVRRQGEKGWRDPEVTAYENEAALQALLESSPELLPGFSGRRLVVAREHSTGYGPADLVAVDTDGNVAIVECKLERNPEIKRKVVGQLFEYAAKMWRSSLDGFVHVFERASSEPLELRLQRIAEESAIPWDSATFREQLASNLEEGRFTLVFAVDRINDELKDVIEFLNAHTVESLSVLGLELGYVRDGEVEILIPGTYGAERVREKVVQARRSWGMEDFYTYLDHYYPAQAALQIREMFDWLTSIGAEVTLGTGASHPTLNARMRLDGKHVRILGCMEHGHVFVNWRALRERVGDERFLQALELLEQRAPGSGEWATREERTGMTAIPKNAVARSGTLPGLKAALTELLEG